MHTQGAGELRDYHSEAWEFMLEMGRGEMEIKMEGGNNNQQRLEEWQ